jgi:hypothetical protein
MSGKSEKAHDRRRGSLRRSACRGHRHGHAFPSLPNEPQQDRVRLVEPTGGAGVASQAHEGTEGAEPRRPRSGETDLHAEYAALQPASQGVAKAGANRFERLLVMLCGRRATLRRIENDTLDRMAPLIRVTYKELRAVSAERDVLFSNKISWLFRRGSSFRSKEVLWSVLWSKRY